VSSLLYVAMNILGAMVWRGYSLTSQTISELSAIDAPSRPLWLALGLVYSLLLIAFGVGVWRSAGPKRALRVAGGLLVGLGVLGLTTPSLPGGASMHQREVLAAGGATVTDTLHLISGAVGSLFCLLIIGFGATVFGRRFRLYSIGTILVMLVFGVVASLDAPRVAANLPTPWVGVTERIMFSSFLLWFAVLATALLRVPVERPQDAARQPQPESGEARGASSTRARSGTLTRRQPSSTQAVTRARQDPDRQAPLPPDRTGF
jgi:hypothetical protein